MSDLIKRVVSIIEDFDVLDGHQDKETLINKIKAISSIELETTSDLIDRQKLLEKAIQIPVAKVVTSDKVIYRKAVFVEDIEQMPSAEPETVRCKDCKYWERKTCQGTPLSWGHCESELMWDSIDGETYEVAHITTNEEHFCGYAERKEHE